MRSGRSIFCQTYKCYAHEIGCCDPEVRSQFGRVAAFNLPCICIDEAFHAPYRDPDYSDVSHLRFRPWVDRYGRVHAHVHVALESMRKNLPLIEKLTFSTFTD